ncbi:RNI-like protein [Mytilinidion resinicola]|uniref:RNI-like protein n=1 Tax=Mytilinidion resinicola TaxID=574789 RepID=A0A6A6Y609_9PEZI|nr:RNI-like protein [Mytilinidion resinicola]KAF2803958.1 RNI-like protein [Mytilinidion resinicola]
MSNRRARNNGANRGTGGIRGPHSALTDFLAANNISAAQIRDSYLQRVQQAEQQGGQEGDEAAPDNGEGSSNQVPTAEEQEAEENAVAEAVERSRKRKRNQEDAIAKVKKGKQDKKKAAAKKKRDSDDEDLDEDYDDALGNMYKKSKPLPGQLENCEICSKRFTVTPYSKTGPEGGLVCTPCGKELAKESKATEKANKPAVRKTRRKLESNRLDGIATHGAKSLQQLCIEKIVQHHQDVEEFGELPDSIINRLCEIFSKKRVLTPQTLKLFLRADLKTVAIHECAYLECEDYEHIFAFVPHIEKLALRNCCQFKDRCVEYMLEKAPRLKHIQLYAANLVTNDVWIKTFSVLGKQLETLKLEWLDAAFDDDAVAAMVGYCPNMSRLKFKRCRQLGIAAIDAIAHLTNLQHLSLQISQEVAGERIVNLIGNVGANLQTLSLERFLDAGDDVLDAIHDQCRSLSKLRFTENDYATDAAFAALFTGWANPPLCFIDVNSNRDIDNGNPEGPEEVIGLGDAGFVAMMEHSGSKLHTLDIASCRHISFATFSTVFDGKKKYPCLEELNVSFCTTVDTIVVAGIFKSCPKLKKLVAFSCFGIEDIIVPAGIVLIGVPKAQDAIEQFGEWGVDVNMALGKMVHVVA